MLPGISGRKLAEAPRRDRPGLPVVFTSGYPDDAPLRDGALEPSATFLQKPYSGEGLARSVRATLDRAAQPSSSSASSSAATTS